MMASPADAFLPGVVGEPGQRTFFVQVDLDQDRRWFVLEKAQVAAFAREAAMLLVEIGFDEPRDSADVESPTTPDRFEFRIAELRLQHDDTTGLVNVALIATDEAEPPVIVALSPYQLEAAARIGAAAVSGGRPQCPRCGLAIDPEGHVCPTTNGDLRHHRP